jgi:hypothetical protein
MEFLEENQICAWAEKHGLSRGGGSSVHLPDLPAVYRREYASGRRSGREMAAAEDLVTSLGAWDECLVWITLWGVWPSGEDWPKFDGWRGALGERRSLKRAPGHRFGSSDSALLTHLVALIMENAWDADILCSLHGRADGLRGKISHDEWYELLAMADPEKSAGY